MYNGNHNLYTMRNHRCMFKFPTTSIYCRTYSIPLSDAACTFASLYTAKLCTVQRGTTLPTKASNDTHIVNTPHNPGNYSLWPVSSFISCCMLLPSDVSLSASVVAVLLCFSVIVLTGDQSLLLLLLLLLILPLLLLLRLSSFGFN